MAVRGCGVTGASWRERSIDDTDYASRQSYLAQISELAMERLTQWTIGQIFPGLVPRPGPAIAADLPVRAVNALARFDCASVRRIDGNDA